MIHAHLRRLHSPDIDDLEHYWPENAEHFGVLLPAMIGPEGQPGEESFDFLVCTPSWLAKLVSEQGYVLGRHYIFVARFDLGLVYDALHTICKQAVREDWQAVAAYLGQYGKWEFEDYRD